MTSYEELHEFITTKKMRMSHIYQPVMLRVLLENGGRASITEIAKAFLAEDRSQIEYYEHIVKVMPGKVLRGHSIVERVGGDFRFEDRFNDLSFEERQDLIQACDDRLNTYLEKHGLGPWQHRRKNRGYISGSMRYEIVRRAKGRCEACGVSSEERPLQVDHIVPKNQGGSDDTWNLQALCDLCNAQKSDRDDTDFAAVRESYSDRLEGCVFCDPDSSLVVVENILALAMRDSFPVTTGHTLVIPRRHVEGYFDLYQPERNAVESLLHECRDNLLGEDCTIDGFNMGSNSGISAGQTVSHAHVHLIPRRDGDTPNPRGGIRGAVPEKIAY